jgi:hypothetical protein
MGDETNSRFSLEAAYNLESRQGKSSNSYLTLGVGLEQKFIPQENLWFLFAFTAEPGRQNGSDFRFNSGIKWEFGSPGNIRMPPPHLIYLLQYRRFILLEVCSEN